jgi:ABC-type sugar transport system permease subunit
MGLIGTLQIFTQAFIMTQGGPVDSTLFYAYHLFNNAFRFLQMGYALRPRLVSLSGRLWPNDHTTPILQALGAL